MQHPHLKLDFHSELTFAPLLLAGVVLVLAALYQLMLMGRSHRSALWAVSTLGSLLVFPAIVLGAFSRVNSAIWLLTAVPWVLNADMVPPTTILLGLLGQLTVFAGLTYRLSRLLHRAGASASKELLIGVNV
jgi:hypothetical protein